MKFTTLLFCSPKQNDSFLQLQHTDWLKRVSLAKLTLPKVFPQYKHATILCTAHKCDSHKETLPFHSPLLRKSLLVPFPLLINMLKFSRYSYMIRVQPEINLCHSVQTAPTNNLFHGSQSKLLSHQHLVEPDMSQNTCKALLQWATETCFNTTTWCVTPYDSLVIQSKTQSCIHPKEDETQIFEIIMTHKTLHFAFVIAICCILHR